MLKRNNKGFTLIEIIISIAVLSIISAIFLELFIKADSVQKQGKILDEEQYVYYYDAFASNLLPDIKVMRKTESEAGYE